VLGEPGNDSSERPAISADGRFVAFDSSASNLVAGDTKGPGVFVRDRQTDRTERVFAGVGFDASISEHGRFVAFTSYAPRPGGRYRHDVLAYDRATRKTTLVSAGPKGARPNGDSMSPAISDSGQFVAFDSTARLTSNDRNDAADVFVRDLQAGSTQLVSVDSQGVQRRRGSGLASISAHGRWVAFVSSARKLVAHDTNSRPDVFVRDRKIGRTERVSVASNGAQSREGGDLSAIASDGRSVVFVSLGSDLVGGDTNGVPDAFVHYRDTGRTRRASVNSRGVQGNDSSLGPKQGAIAPPSLSLGGRFAAFQSLASNLVPFDTNGTFDVFVRGPLQP
jgi:Tol biopolymer transport system component